MNKKTADSLLLQLSPVLLLVTHVRTRSLYTGTVVASGVTNEVFTADGGRFEGDYSFGNSVDYDGNILLVQMRHGDASCAYLYVRDGNDWDQVAALSVPGAGRSFAIDGEFTVVGSEGTVYVSSPGGLIIGAIDSSDIVAHPSPDDFITIERK